MEMTALMFVRNGEAYLERCLRHLGEQGLDVVVIDHGSNDGTPAILARHRPHCVRDVVRIPYEGAFDLEQMLLLQREQTLRLGLDWYLRVDVDEIPLSDRPEETLRQALERIDAGGWDAVNFAEFVFVYESDTVSHAGTDYVESMRSYYHFAPEPIRLIRAFRSGLPVDNVAHAGHKLPLDRIRLYEGTFVLKHYIALSRAHAEDKYLGRTFALRNLARGWHFNRVNIRADQLAAPSRDQLQHLESPDSPLDASRPLSTHFWEWAATHQHPVSARDLPVSAGASGAATGRR